MLKCQLQQTAYIHSFVYLCHIKYKTIQNPFRACSQKPDRKTRHQEKTVS